MSESTELASALQLDKHSFKGCRIQVNEEENRLGAFLLHHFLARNGPSRKSLAVLVSMEYTFGHYHAIGMKTGVNLLKQRDAKQLVFVDGLRLAGQAFCQHQDRRQAAQWLGDEVVRQVEEAVRQFSMDFDIKADDLVIVMDKWTSLLSMGASMDQMIDWTQVMQSLALGSQACLIGLCTARLCHPDDLHEAAGLAADCRQLALYLGHTSDLHVVISPLASGRCAEVSGSLTFSWNKKDQERFQFRLDDKRVAIFAPGTSKAVL